jgi:hypothetical protein
MERGCLAAAGAPRPRGDTRLASVSLGRGSRCSASGARAVAAAQAAAQATPTMAGRGAGRRATRSCSWRSASASPLNTTCVQPLLSRSATVAPRPARRRAKTALAFKPSVSLRTSTCATTPRKAAGAGGGGISSADAHAVPGAAIGACCARQARAGATQRAGRSDRRFESWV